MAAQFLLLLHVFHLQIDEGDLVAVWQTRLVAAPFVREIAQQVRESRHVLLGRDDVGRTMPVRVVLPLLHGQDRPRPLGRPVLRPLARAFLEYGVASTHPAIFNHHYVLLEHVLIVARGQDALLRLELLP